MVTLDYKNSRQDRPAASFKELFYGEDGTVPYVEIAPLRLRPGAVYLYTAPYPHRCRGHRYRLVRLVRDVPSYQEKCLVEALTGPDEGLWFTCTQANFGERYVLAEGQE
jgi:hypothetical protein